MIHNYVDRALAKLIEAEGLGNLDWFAYQNDRINMTFGCAGATLAPGLDLVVSASIDRRSIDTVCLVKNDCDPSEFPLISRFKDCAALVEHIEKWRLLAGSEWKAAASALVTAGQALGAVDAALANLQPMMALAAALAKPTTDSPAATDPDATGPDATEPEQPDPSNKPWTTDDPIPF
jgi:hypothetical protein